MNMNSNEQNESLFSKDESALLSRGYQRLTDKITGEEFNENLELYKLKERMSSLDNEKLNYFQRISHYISDSFGINLNLQISGAGAALVSIGIIFGMQMTTSMQGSQLNQANNVQTKNASNFQSFNAEINSGDLLTKVDYKKTIKSDDSKKIFFEAIELAIDSKLTTMVEKKQGLLTLVVSNFKAGDISQERFKSFLKIPKEQNGTILIEFIETKSK